MHRHTRRDWWDRLFAIGIVAKGVDGVLELVGGILLLFVSPAQIHRVAAALTQHELSEDPNDFIATHILHSTIGLSSGTVVFAAIYLLLHGAVKVVLVVALLRKRMWAYPWMIGVLVAFIAYQCYRIALSPSVGLILLTIFDAFIVVLTWHEYRRQRARIGAVEPGTVERRAARPGSNRPSETG